MSESVVTHEVARDESVCGVFCDAEPEVSFEAFGYTFHWCRDCYERDCGRCNEPIPESARGSTRAKGWCEDCREAVRMLCGDDERGLTKDPDEEQTRLITDGGTCRDDTEHTCPGCDDETTFSKGGRFGTLSCDSCNYTPKKSVRDDIRSVQPDSDRTGGDGA